MNITGGSLRGRKVKTVESKDVRPTSSKVRESIFNIIQLNENGFITHKGETIFLDLFAGSGIIGLEALSRGAKKVTYVEKNTKVAMVLRENLAAFNLNTELIQADALHALERFKGRLFNLIFIDPPYASGLIEPVLNLISKNNLLAEGGIIIIEHSPSLNLAEIAEKLNFTLYKEKKYGDTALTMLIY